MDSAAVSQVAADLPREPGVYQFLDGGTVLYVGKAVDLLDRVRSYVDPRSERIRRMVERATDVDVTVTETETQALLLEANLIKRHQPRYNVRLKDDKSYPLVQLTGHEYPRIQITRDPEDGGTVFGPFTDVGRVETVVKAIREIYGLRGCSDHKFRGRDRPCLDYELGLCSAPCVDEIDRETYAEDVAAAEQFFAGETGVLAEPLRAAMETAAGDAEFERAANLRDRLEAVEAFHGTGGVAVDTGITDGDTTRDILGVDIRGDSATVARLHGEGGQLVDRTRHKVELPKTEQNAGAVLAAFIPQFYAERELPDTIMLPEPLDNADVDQWLQNHGVEVRVPGAGRAAQLVELALKNASRGGETQDELAALGAALDIPRPSRIEAMDVSHASGRAVVGSNVTLVDGQPETDDYRRKKLPDENDDPAAINALVGWRAERAIEGRDDRPDPDLLLIDGGEAQLDAAIQARDRTGWDIPIVALAKGEGVVHTADREYDWDQDASHLHVLQRARDEAHRFAVQYHRTVRDEVSTVLEDVEGIGSVLRQRLLGRFGSVDGVREASITELRDVEGVGPDVADRLDRRL
ncbi:MAG: excinuclease ABC subunit C [Halobacteriaceae archaeon]